jgi:DNA polymerase-3 subunit delta'
MPFLNIRDQDVPVRFLRNLLKRKRIPNGLLFWGPPGVGKRLAAYEFAKAVNCREAEFDACGQCNTCRRILHGNHPDVIALVPTKKSRTISVEAIESVIEMASLRPYESPWRIFIIHDAEGMRDPAQNHLLKTLEEPSSNSVFILITTSPQFLLPTIRSRCQRVRFGALRRETVAEILMRDREITEETALSIAGVSQGQMTRAFDLADSEKRTVVLDFVARLAKGEDALALSEAFSHYLEAQRAQLEAAIKANSDGTPLEDLSPEDRERIKEEHEAMVDALIRRDIIEHIFLLETWYRDLLVYGATGDVSRVFNRDVSALLQKAEGAGAAEKLAALDKARRYLERFLKEERVFRDLFFALAP